MKIIIKALLSLSLVFSLAQAKEFVVDTTHTNIGFSIKHMMISNVKGNFNTYTTMVDFDADKKVFTKLSASIDASSVDTNMPKRDEHLRSAEFFDVAQFKTIDFVMDSMKDGKVYGKITIHGVTKDIVLNATIHGVVKDPQGKQRAGLTLEGKINRKDFGLTWSKVLEGGGLMVDDTVNLIVDMEIVGA